MDSSEPTLGAPPPASDAPTTASYVPPAATQASASASDATVTGAPPLNQAPTKATRLGHYTILEPIGRGGMGAPSTRPSASLGASAAMIESCWVYIAELRDGALYVGMTSDLDRRAMWLRGGRGHAGRRGFIRFLWTERHSDRRRAAARERQLKRWSRAKKLALVREDFDELCRLAKRRTDSNSP